MKIKVCGMREPENIIQLGALEPDYIGFIFYPNSKRHVSSLDIEELNRIPKSIKKTGVFVNENLSVILDNIKHYGLDAVQLHGDELPAFCKEVSHYGVEIIKAFGVNAKFDFKLLKPYINAADYFLFDTQTPRRGGSGKSFDWQILDNYPYSKPYFLSGGISLENIEEVKQIKGQRLYAVDLNSCFEDEPGLKNIEKIKEALMIINQ